MSPPGIAFFDLDRTVLSVNSATGWVRREVRLGYVSTWTALKAALWIGRYQLGFSKMEAAIKDAVRSLEGDSEDVIRQRTLDFWNEEVKGTIRPGASTAVARHKAAGQPCVLLTSSSPYLSQAAVDALDLDGFLCNVFDVVDGVFTGATREPLCFGRGKIVYARAFAEARGVSLDRCTFYTDSMSDLPLMEVVGHPVAVAPDPLLAREAKRRGWPIEDWDRGTGG